MLPLDAKNTRRWAFTTLYRAETERAGFRRRERFAPQAAQQGGQSTFSK
jgi:hypothetical protein